MDWPAAARRLRNSIEWSSALALAGAVSNAAIGFVALKGSKDNNNMGAVLAFLGVALAPQLVAFAVVSIIVFAAFRPLAHRLDQSADDHGVGAKRLVGAGATVLEEIPAGNVGMVRIGAEEWRAVAADDEPIPAGTHVTVREIKGTRAVVEPVD